jgi:hypothetical protein
MGCEVYANNMSIACKAADGKTIAAFPDVCFTPPLTPATPPGVPIPYPNTAMASDTTDGSKTVMISGQEVMLKDKSVFKTSTGDEAGSAPKKGVVTSQIKGKVNFTSWSMDVKFEGENVPRHLDLTLHNEASLPANTLTWPYLDRVAMAAATSDCADEISAVDAACSKKDGKVVCPAQGSMTKEQYALTIENDPCQRAARCLLSPKDPSRCCAPQTPHHLIPKAGFFSDKFNGTPFPGNEQYNQAKAPCVCAEGGKSQGTHGLLHDAQTKGINKNFAGKDSWKFSDAVKNASEAMGQVCPQCGSKCIESQLQQEHGRMRIGNNADLRPIRQEPSDISGFRETFQALQRTFSSAQAGGEAI